MKVLMISSNTAASPYLVYPLGLSMVASALDKAGHEVRQLDFLQKGSSFEALMEEVSGFNPKVVGISIRNIDNVNFLNEQRYIGIVRKIVEEIRNISDARVMLGGAGFSLIPELILNETGADYGIIGEGESLMVDFVNNAEKGIFPEHRLLGPERRLEGKLIPSALYDNDLLSFYKKKVNIASVQTKRGCPYKCAYCTYPVLEGNSIRLRDPSEVVDDIEFLRERHKIKYLFFTDSVFNDDRGSYLEVIKEMKRRKVSVPWTAFFKPVGLDDRTLELMKETGLASAEVGSDAACDTTLKAMGKSFTFSDIEKFSDLLVKHKVALAHFYMFGGPEETKETVLEGIDNIKRMDKCVHFIYMGIRILPDTPLAKLALKENIISPEDGLLDPRYYISPNIDEKWLEDILSEAFSGLTNCIFPPESLDDKLRLLHKMGYSGPMWDLLISKKKSKEKKEKVVAGA